MNPIATSNPARSTVGFGYFDGEGAGAPSISEAKPSLSFRRPCFPSIGTRGYSRMIRAMIADGLHADLATIAPFHTLALSA